MESLGYVISNNFILIAADANFCFSSDEYYHENRNGK